MEGIDEGGTHEGGVGEGRASEMLDKQVVDFCISSEERRFLEGALSDSSQTFQSKLLGDARRVRP